MRRNCNAEHHGNEGVANGGELRMTIREGPVPDRNNQKLMRKKTARASPAILARQHSEASPGGQPQEPAASQPVEIRSMIKQLWRTP